jgi:hypothetical protein
MASIADLDISGLFKKVYGGQTDLLPDGFPLQKMVSVKKTGGESHNESVQLSHENGVTLIGDAGEVVDFESANSGVVKQASIKCKEMFLSSALATGTIANSASAGEKAFAAATKDRVAANIRSHSRIREHMCLYGQSEGLGRVNFATGNFRGVAFVEGGGTIGGITLVDGVDTVNKVIMINPSDIASGIFQGAEGMEVEQVITATGAIADAGSAKGKIVSVDIRNGLVKVDFTPVVATSLTSHVLMMKGQRLTKEMIGAKKILTNAGTLFGIDASKYNLWQGSNFAVTGKLTFAKLAEYLEQLCDFGLEKDVEVHISFESWKTLLVEADALRKMDASYDEKKVKRGHEVIEFYFVNGVAKIVPNRFVRRGDAFVFESGAWAMMSVSEVGFNVPGSDGDLIVKPINNNSYIYRSYSSSQLFCYAPRKSAYLSGINPEANS